MMEQDTLELKKSVQNDRLLGQLQETWRRKRQRIDEGLKRVRQSMRLVFTPCQDIQSKRRKRREDPRREVHCVTS
jgi:hypothetical protein